MTTTSLAAIHSVFAGVPAIAQTNGVLCLTFDDSHFDDWEAVMPLFEKYNARGTFFARGELTPRCVAGMRRLSEAGHSIGLHGRLHARAPACLGEISTSKGRERVFAKLRSLGVSAVWFEGFRLGQSVPEELLREERDAFRAAGFDVRGCIHPTMLNRYTEEEKKTLSRARIVKPCFNDPDAVNRMRDEFLKLARVFDEVIIDDSFNTFCGDECPRCKAAREAEGWKDPSAYYCSLVERIGRDFVVKPTREVNPKFRLFFKFPDWYYMWRSRGMDAQRIVEIFGDCWIGNETRDRHPEPLQACWYVQRANRLFGDRCGGAWFDPLDSEPEKFVEQARYA